MKCYRQYTTEVKYLTNQRHLGQQHTSVGYYPHEKFESRPTVILIVMSSQR